MNKSEERESVVLENQGQKIFGILHRPTIQKPPFPAVLICHGLAGQKVGKYRLYVILAEQLSSLGIASLRIDFRGSGDSEGDFGDMTIETEVSDAIVALNYLRHRKDIDPKRLGLFGRSVGGTVAFIAAQKTGCIKSIATWAPLYDGEQWEKRWHQLHAPEVTPDYRTEMMKVNGQVPGPGFFKGLFAMRMEDHLKGLETIPILHIHGERDPIVIPQHAERYLKARERAKGSDKFLRLPESDHDFSHTKEQLLALKETTDWFVKTL